MKTIIVGYTDRGGIGAPEILCGPETPAAIQARIMEDAKLRHKFPEHMARVEMYALGEPVEIAIFISEEAAQAAQDVDAHKSKVRKEEKERAQAQLKADANIVAANKAFTVAAGKRNNAIAAVAAQKGLLSAVGDKEKASVLKKLETLQPQADQAIAEFAVVRIARDVIKNAKSTPEEVAAALAQIADPAAAVEAAKKAAAETASAPEGAS